jgi:hypothetical protein
MLDTCMRRIAVNVARPPITDGHLPYPYGHEMTGYDVPAIAETLTKAKTSGATILIEAYKTDGRETAIVEFPGGYIAEIHSSAK